MRARRLSGTPVFEQNGPVIGRFAPSPTGPLHVGNLRTALITWLSARAAGGEMLVRIEDLDRANSSLANERAQLGDLGRLGLLHPPAVIRQSERFDLYRSVIDDLRGRGLVYACYCSRREIRDAVAAPHGELPEGAYPGTCRDLNESERRRREGEGRRPAWRLRTDGETYRVHDVVAGPTSTRVDDFVLQRNDGIPAYNLAVVVDDAAQGVTQVVRGDDLLLGTGRQIHLQRLLGLPTPEYAHVPLVVGPDGERLAKRHGAVTLNDLGSIGVTAAGVLRELASSIGIDQPDVRTAADLIDRFDWRRVPRSAWMIPSNWQRATT